MTSVEFGLKLLQISCISTFNIFKIKDHNVRIEGNMIDIASRRKIMEIKDEESHNARNKSND